jgi:hypothetical protein
MQVEDHGIWLAFTITTLALLLSAGGPSSNQVYCVFVRSFAASRTGFFRVSILGLFLGFFRGQTCPSIIRAATWVYSTVGDSEGADEDGRERVVELRASSTGVGNSTTLADIFSGEFEW